mgnify:CR=1 FL=1
MAKWATGKRSLAISDRSGMAFPYTEMVKEWNGSLVHYSEFEPKHPQIRRRHFTADAIALQNTRPMKSQTPTKISTINPQAPNDNTIASSGGRSMGTVNLTLPGQFAFNTQYIEVIRDGVTTILHSMIPANPSLQNRRRELLTATGTVTVSIS